MDEDDRTEDDQGQAASLVELRDVVNEALQYIVSFLVHADRLKVAETCKSLCSAVDAYSAASLVNICKEHPSMDANFLDRVAASFPSSERPVPRRCLWKRAQSHPLYQIGTLQRRNVAYMKPVISEDGSRIAVLGFPIAVLGFPQRNIILLSVFDSATQTLLRERTHYDIPKLRNFCQHRAVWVGSTIVAYVGTTLVFDETLELMDFPDLKIESNNFLVLNDSATILSSIDRGRLLSFDMATGTTKELASSSRGRMLVGLSENRRWLVAKRHNGAPLQTLGLHNDCTVVFSMTNHQDTPHMVDHFPDTVFIRGPSQFYVLGLDGVTGQLFNKRTCPLMSASSWMGILKCGLFVKRFYFAETAGQERGPFSVLDPLTGAFLRDLQVPDGYKQSDVPDEFESNGKEVFLTGRCNGDSTVVVYLSGNFY